MKLLKNYAYNLSYQILLIILPIITIPYVTRIFSSEELGTYNFHYSIVTYFVLLATLGVANYGTRQISANVNAVRETFWGIFMIQCLAGILSTGLYLVVCFLVVEMSNPIAFMLVLTLISKTLDISWLFRGLEDFKRVTIRNIIVKLLGVTSILIFVNKPSDLVLYVFLLVIFELLGQMSMWLPAQQYIGKPMIDTVAMRSNIKPIIQLFLPTVAISLYVTMDRTLLGILATTDDVGIYEQAYKLISILLTLVTSLGAVMLPRISNLLSIGDHKRANQLHELSFLAYNLVIFPLIAGLLIINDDFVSLFFGEDFQDARYAIAIMVFKLFFIGWTNIMGIQLLIPFGKNKEFMISTTIPALMSIAMNIWLIPYLGFIGASVTSVLTEALVWMIQLYYTRSYLKDLDILKPMTKIIFSTLLMFLVLVGMRQVVHLSAVMNTFLAIFVGGSIYLVSIYFLKVIDIAKFKAGLKL